MKKKSLNKTAIPIIKKIIYSDKKIIKGERIIDHDENIKFLKRHKLYWYVVPITEFKNKNIDINDIKDYHEWSDVFDIVDKYLKNNRKMMVIYEEEYPCNGELYIKKIGKTRVLFINYFYKHDKFTEG